MSEATTAGDVIADPSHLSDDAGLSRVILGTSSDELPINPPANDEVRIPPPGRPLQSRATLRARRLVFASLVLGTLVLLVGVFAHVLNHDGLSVLDFAILTAFVITAPWNIIGFWNAIIGFILLRLGEPGMKLAAPHLETYRADEPVHTRTAIAMAIRHENVERVIARLRVMERDLHATPHAEAFDFHILSDSARDDVVAAEERAIAEWRRVSPAPARIHYRRRTENIGYKAGNLREFCVAAADDYDFFLPLDADSLMSAGDILRLVRIMEANPRVGLLQSLVVGLPSDRFFTRVFQFGMRHGMRTYTTGSAWWQADCGPYWGHNALIRLSPFRDACHLPVLPGRPPLGGYVLSHDQIEAAMLRRAGYECRVLPLEGESYEENPPTLPDFNKRDLRWCQGNMQYFRLLNLPGLVPTSRIQVALAILMYFGSAGWMAFCLASALLAHQALLPTAIAAPILFAEEGVGAFPVGLAVGMFVLIFLMNITPKIAGLFDVLSSRENRAKYGGTRRVLQSFFVEFVFTLLLAPAVALSVTIFMVGLLFGKRVVWDGQARDGHRVAWRDALGSYWPHMLVGAILTAAFYIANPVFVTWGAPVLLGLALAPLFAVVTASDTLSTLCVKWRLCEVPEEIAPSAVMTALDAELQGDEAQFKAAA